MCGCCNCQKKQEWCCIKKVIPVCVEVKCKCYPKCSCEEKPESKCEESSHKCYR